MENVRIKGIEVLRELEMLAEHIADIEGVGYEDYVRTVGALEDDSAMTVFLMRVSAARLATEVGAIKEYRLFENSENRENPGDLSMEFVVDGRRLGVRMDEMALRQEILTYIVARSVEIWLGLGGSVYGQGTRALAAEIAGRLEGASGPARCRSRRLPAL